MTHATGTPHHAVPQDAAGAAGAAETSGPGGAWVAFAVVVATTAVTLWALLMPRVSAHAPAPPAPAAPQAGLGALVERTLPGGARVAVPERGVEGRLLAFIADAGRPADATTWFDFDRLTFETGSSALGAGSRDQLAAVAAILGAYPAVKLKIGGYTDNVGDPASNQRLSEQRAASVRLALTGLGVTPERLVAEGYGDQHPVADNATPEGRARNRRISMRVLEK
jgi:OmpA-OmpF porin, OOP family